MTELEQLRKEVNELRERLAKLEAAPRTTLPMPQNPHWVNPQPYPHWMQPQPYWWTTITCEANNGLAS